MNRTLLLYAAVALLATLLAWSTWNNLGSKRTALVSALRAELSECAQERESACFKNASSDLLEQYDLKTLMEGLEDGQDDPTIYRTCHTFAHYAGRAAYAYTGDIPSTFASCTGICSGGCYHGAVEQHLAEQDLTLQDMDDAYVTQILTQTCGSEDDFTEPIRLKDCLHGLGHALMYVTEGNLESSLAYCDLLNDDHAPACHSGVFMENAVNLVSDEHPSQYLDPDDPLYPCSALPERYLYGCYTYQTYYFIEAADRDWAEVSRLCETVPAAYQPTCFGMIGTHQTRLLYNSTEGRAHCDAVPQKYKATCIQGMVSSIGFRFPQEPIRMAVFCESVDTSLKRACYTQLGDTARVLARKDQTHQDICAVIPQKEDRDTCMWPATRD